MFTSIRGRITGGLDGRFTVEPNGRLEISDVFREVFQDRFLSSMDSKRKAKRLGEDHGRFGAAENEASSVGFPPSLHSLLALRRARRRKGTKLRVESSDPVFTSGSQCPLLDWGET